MCGFYFEALDTFRKDIKGHVFFRHNGMTPWQPEVQTHVTSYSIDFSIKIQIFLDISKKYILQFKHFHISLE